METGNGAGRTSPGHPRCSRVVNGDYFGACNFDPKPYVSWVFIRCCQTLVAISVLFQTVDLCRIVFLAF